ncbi:MAG TPA: hypothetical protein VMS62_14430, partial [Gemmatimonadales bacterium]|nr:hypothetical protein [Gemmatimonadales bacterium]
TLDLALVCGPPIGTAMVMAAALLAGATALAAQEPGAKGSSGRLSECLGHSTRRNLVLVLSPNKVAVHP